MMFARRAGSIWLVFLLGGVTLLGCTQAPPAPVVAGTITLEIGAPIDKKFTLEDIPAGSTVESIMRRVPESDLPMEITGSGTTAFLVSIGDQGTEAGEGWIFRIDGNLPERGIGVTEVDPPATISWTYGGMPQ
ncbi:MAG: DUF4430 domain-containing protein [Planctomycetota bacterium]